MSERMSIRGIARRAGVSVGTVSNVLNKPAQVSPEMVERVQRVIEEVGFVRNDHARQLKMGESSTIGMIVLNVANPFFADLAHACEAAAEERGYTVVLGSSDQMPERENRYIDLFEEQRVKGMLIATLDGMTARTMRLRQRGVPFVLFDDRDDATEVCSVVLDGDAGGFLAGRHLIEQGKRRIALLGGPLHQVRDRWSGLMKACAQHVGVALSHLDTTDQTIADGYAAGVRLASLPAAERPDGVLAANDLLALGVLSALMSAGVRVPEDIAIVGYDDIPYAGSAIVPLSSIRQPIDLLASEAVRLLLSEGHKNSEHTHERVRLAPELVVRRSSQSL